MIDSAHEVLRAWLIGILMCVVEVCLIVRWHRVVFVGLLAVNAWNHAQAFSRLHAAGTLQST